MVETRVVHCQIGDPCELVLQTYAAYLPSLCMHAGCSTYDFPGLASHSQRTDPWSSTPGALVSVLRRF